MTRELEGLPWPEGDPGGLRAAGTHALTLARELEGRQSFLTGVDPIGWLGAGRDEFAVSLARHGDALGSGARAMTTAGNELAKLAGVVETAQQTVIDAAGKLQTARQQARDTLARAQQARAVADQEASMASVFVPMGPPAPSPAELDAQAAERTAANAAAHAVDVERWAMQRATAAVRDTQRADRACAGALETAGLVSAPDVTAAECLATPPGGPLPALGRFLLGSGADTGGSLVDFLASPPPPPPPPPPKPPETHHSWLKGLEAGGLVIVTGGLTVLDAAQLGLDPLTDGATVATGTEAGVLGTEAIAGETVAATDAAATDAAATDAAATDAAAADTAPPTWSPDDGTPVLGRLPDTEVAKDWPGHSVLDDPYWTPERNDGWIQSIIDQRGEPYLASPEDGNLWDYAYDRPTVYGRELDQLRGAGYGRFGDTMQPPPP